MIVISGKDVSCRVFSLSCLSLGVGGVVYMHRWHPLRILCVRVVNRVFFLFSLGRWSEARVVWCGVGFVSTYIANAALSKGLRLASMYHRCCDGVYFVSKPAQIGSYNHPVAMFTLGDVVQRADSYDIHNTERRGDGAGEGGWYMYAYMPPARIGGRKCQALLLLL